MARRIELEWANAYLSQAKADYGAALALEDRPEASVLAMLLQMALEKLSKAALLRLSSLSLAQARSQHRVAARFMQTIRMDARIAVALGFHSAEDFFLATMSVDTAIRDLEDSNPAVARRIGRAEILEYPWEEASGAIRWPEAHHPVVRLLRQPEGGLKERLLHFIGTLLRRFELAFPAV